MLGENVFYTGSSQILGSGDKVVHGQKGNVVGPGDATGKGVMVLFPGNKGNVNCYLPSVRCRRATSAVPRQPLPWPPALTA